MPSSGAKRQGKPNERGHYCSEWIKSYILDYGDQMPTVCLFRLDPVKLKDERECCQSQPAIRHLVVNVTDRFEDNNFQPVGGGSHPLHNRPTSRRVQYRTQNRGCKQP